MTMMFHFGSKCFALTFVFLCVSLAPTSSQVFLEEGVYAIGSKNTQNKENRRLQNWNNNNNNNNRRQKCCPEDAIGTVYGSLVIAISRNPSLSDELLKTAIIGHASILAGNDPGNTAEEAAVIVSEIKTIFDNLFDNETFFP